MNNYTIKWRRKSIFGLFTFWKTEKNLIGNVQFLGDDKEVFFYADGSKREVCEWSKCEAIYGIDWVAFEAKKASKDAGIPVNLAPGIGEKS